MSTYTVWAAMKQRCNNPNNCKWDLYGGRGITYGPKWETFSGFFSDMGAKPFGKTLDRIDPEKGYYKENCRWATPSEQNRNCRLRTDNKTGLKGVEWKPKLNRWQARGGNNRQQKMLYWGTDFFEAVCARKSWELGGVPR